MFGDWLVETGSAMVFQALRLSVKRGARQLQIIPYLDFIPFFVILDRMIMKGGKGHGGKIL